MFVLCFLNSTIYTVSCLCFSFALVMGGPPTKFRTGAGRPAHSRGHCRRRAGWRSGRKNTACATFTGTRSQEIQRAAPQEKMQVLVHGRRQGWSPLWVWYLRRKERSAKDFWRLGLQRKEFFANFLANGRSHCMIFAACRWGGFSPRCPSTLSAKIHLWLVGAEQNDLPRIAAR